MKLRNFLQTAVAATIALGSSSAFAATFTITSFDGGWYSDQGRHVSSNPNNITGDNGSRDYRSFYAFKTSGLVGQDVLGAEIIFAADGRYRSPDSSEVLGLFDVSTPTGLLTSQNFGRTDIYRDLGTGDQYGQYVYSAPNGSAMRQFSFNLNAEFLKDINATIDNSGSDIAIGAAILSLGGAAVETLWSSSRRAGSATLRLTTTPEVIDVNPVPIPGALPLFLAGLGGITAMRRSKR